MRHLVQYLICLVVAILGACVDPISFEVDSEEGDLVLYGNFSQLEESHFFNISRTAEFNRPTTPVSGATVEIKDNEGNVATYQEVEAGKYELRSDQMVGVPGRSYHIEVSLGNGEMYRSDPKELKEPVEMENLYYEIGTREELSGQNIPVEQTFIDIFVDTPLDDICGQPSDLRWTVEEVYSFVDRSCGPFDFAETCYFIDPVDESEVLLFQNQGSQPFLERFRVRTRMLVPFDEFTARHYFIVRQYAIPENELVYWEQIDAVANQSGDLFDVQPARVLGNIYKVGASNETVLGYFGVHGQNLERIFITPFEIRPNPVFTCMDDAFFRENVGECCFCHTKMGIQIPRPDYWDED